MKNREKYAEEIKNYIGTNFCKYFIKPVVLNKENCYGIGCERCAILTALWLEEDYEEPEVDWSKVEVDTPILVRNNEDDEWLERYFARYENEIIYVWCDGRTSWTAYDNDDVFDWDYAKLAEQEESDE